MIGALVTAVVVACGDSAGSSPGVTDLPTAAPTESPSALGPLEPEVARIEEHIRVLSEEIGVRTAGSPEEQEVIEYAKGQLERWGYQVEIQAFEVSHELLRSAGVTAGDRKIEALPFLGSPSGVVTAPLVDAGTGREEEFPSEADGAIVLIQRRDVPFVDMAARAKAAGAVAVVVANKEPELFQFGFFDPIGIPFVAIDGRDGDALRALLADGPVEATVEVEEQRELTAHNVIARPDSGECRTLSGGHYDSVPVAPGANDNASGAGTVLELARAAAAAELSGNCFALFGAEEIGLEGSAFFVSELSAEERENLRAVFNYDVVGGEGSPALIGSPELGAQADALADRIGVPARPDTLPEGASSDHASFLNAQIPALMLTTPGFGRIHTAQDTVRNLEPLFLDEIATLGFALMEENDG